ncbi:MAG: twin transmembrane helix small protein [Granulosicoccus sp.]|nr:twin transmembrane helix small protein [Granulosicoccus sp.]
MLFIKFIVLLLLGFVIVSLFSGLYFLVKDKGQTNRTVNALSIRIGLSILVIVIVMVAGVTGIIEMNPSPFSSEQQSRQSDSTEKDQSNGGGRRPIQPDNQ